MARRRGSGHQPAAIFSYVSAEERALRDHPLRAIRTFVDEILQETAQLRLQALGWTAKAFRSSIE
jgi:hypothetical protein